MNAIGMHYGFWSHNWNEIDYYYLIPKLARLGFDISEKAVKRAGLDYWHLVEVYDYENFEYVEAEITLDPYTQLGVEVTPSANAEWDALYYGWLDAATYADYGAYEEDLVDYLLENSYPNTPAEVKSWPVYLVQEVSPATTPPTWKALYRSSWR